MNRQSAFFKIVALILVASFYWTPFSVMAASYKDRASSIAGKATSGQTFSVGESGISYGDGKSFNTKSMAQNLGSAEERSQYDSLSGSGRDHQNMVQMSGEYEETSQRTNDRAYATLLRGARANPHYSLTNSSIWAATDHVMQNKDQILQDMFGDCTATTTTTPTSVTRRLPDMKTCERPAGIQDTCMLYQEVSVEEGGLPPWFSQTSTSRWVEKGFFGTPSPKISASVSSVNNSWRLRIRGSWEGIHWQYYKYKFYVDDVNAFNEFYIHGKVMFDDTGIVWLLNSEGQRVTLASNRGASWITSGANAPYYKVDTGHVWGYYDPAVADLKPHITQGWNEIGVSVWNDARGGDVDVTFIIGGGRRLVSNWYPQSCIDQINAWHASGTQCTGGTGVFTYTQVDPATGQSQQVQQEVTIDPDKYNVIIGPNQDGCTSMAGIYVCEGDGMASTLAPAPVPDLSNLVTQVEFDPPSCAADLYQDTCAELRGDPVCQFKSQRCSEEDDGTGACTMIEETWDCGEDVTVDSVNFKDNFVCGGEIACVDGSCTEQEDEINNGSMVQVAGMYTAISAIKEEGNCDGTNCVIFAGEHKECRVGAWGEVDCCDSPQAVSLTDYMKGVMYARKAGALDALQNSSYYTTISSKVSSAAQPVTDFASKGYNEMKKVGTDLVSSIQNQFMTSAKHTVVDEAAKEMGGEAVQQSVFSEVQQQVMTWLMEKSQELMGESVTNLLFQEVAVNAAGEAVAEGSTDAVGTMVQMGPAVGFLMSAYAAYQLAIIAMNVIWACEEEDQEVAVKKELKLAHKVGVYCSQEILGGCAERTHSYCVYQSPLARIIMEQAMPLLGKSYGDKENPNCDGLTIEEFSRLDFSRIDLSEWEAILIKSQILPTVQTDMLERVTGSGSFLAVEGQRDNAAERLDSRSSTYNANGNPDIVKEVMREELWGTP